MIKENNLKITIGSFDLIKGTQMLMVIIWHMLPYYDLRQFAWLLPFTWFVKVCCYGSMFVFYFSSGYNFRERSVKSTLQKTFREMIVPYIVVMLCVVVLFPIIHFLNYRYWPGAVEETIKLVLSFLFVIPESGKVLFGYTLYSCGPVWFLMALFIAQNIVNLILKIKNVKLQILAITFCFFTGIVLFRIDFSYYCIPRSLLMVEGIYFGYICKKYKLLSKLYHCKTLYFCLFLLVTMVLVFGRFDMTSESCLIVILTYFCSEWIGFLLVLFGIWVNQFEGKFLDVFRSVGMYTYWILCIHCVELLVIPWYRWGAVMTEHPILAFIIDGCVKTAIILSVCKVLKKISRYQYKRRLKKHA